MRGCHGRLPLKWHVGLPLSALVKKEIAQLDMCWWEGWYFEFALFRSSNYIARVSATDNTDIITVQAV